MKDKKLIEFAVIQRGRMGKPDFEVMKVEAYSSDHASYLAKQRGVTDIATVLHTAGVLYRTFWK